MVTKLLSFMMLCSVSYDHIITAEHIHLLHQFTVLVLNTYDDGYDTALHSWCDV